MVWFFATGVLLFSVGTVLLARLAWWWLPLLACGYAVGAVLLFFLLTIVASFFLRGEKTPEKQNRFCRGIQLIAYSIALRVMRVRVQVVGEELLPPEQVPFLLAANHLSNYDHMLAVTRFRKRRLAFASKAENFSIPVVGKYLRYCAFLPIDRKNPRMAIRTLREMAERMRTEGLSYGIFPEGTRSRSGALLPFHDGVFLAAKQAKAPVAVVRMEGTDRISCRGPFRSTRVTMRILACLDATFVATHRDTEISAVARAMIAGVADPYGVLQEKRLEAAPEKV